MDFERELAESSLKINSIKLRPQDPFPWASAYFMPIYNDNRMRLWHPEMRAMTASAWAGIMEREGISADIIAGTSTAGISPGTTLPDKLSLPFVYIRDKPKEHGLKNQIEGLDSDKDFEGKRVLVIEDLISTGGSSAAAVQAVRDAKGVVEHCFSIFNYGLEDAKLMFEGKIPFGKDGRKLNPACQVRSALTYPKLLEVAVATGYVNAEQAEMLKQWRADPFDWGRQHGYHWLRGVEVAQLNGNEEKARKRVCLALDVQTVREALALADGFSDVVGSMKVGKTLHATACNEGVPIVERIYERGGQVFLDLKLHDTPDQVYGAAQQCTIPGVYMFNVHIAGGEKMCREAVRGAREAAASRGIPTPKVIGVTVLTSIDNSDLAAEGLYDSKGEPLKFDDLMLRRTELAKNWGLDGIVCPAIKAGELEKRFGEWCYVTPGIKYAGVQNVGQKQLDTPDGAVQACKSSILVIGSAITKAPDRRQTAKDILKSMAPYV